VSAPVAVRGGVTALGDRALRVLDGFGGFGLLAVAALRAATRRRFPLREVLLQFESTVVRSTSVVTLTALFTGMVLALQTVVSLTRFGAKPYTGAFVSLAQVLELGPVLTAVMVSGRVGAGITAEIGSMAVTEQVDAIRALGADPVQKLVLPRVLALTLGVPLLTVVADFMGVFGGLLISTQYGISSSFYYQTVVNTVTLDNFVQGIAKTFFFGWTISMVGCYMGLSTEGGTVGVGRATTQAVVVASISVFILDFFLSQIMILL
jgi:phospholipid/cholesterol/gamma-HCH transport system permease protein